MVSKIIPAALVAAATVKQAAAAHGHQHRHADKREIHWAETDTVVVTDWYTVYVTPGAETVTAADVTTVKKPTHHQKPTTTEEPTTTTTLTSSVFTTTTMFLSSAEAPAPSSSSSASSSSSSSSVVVPTSTAEPTVQAVAPTTLVTSSVQPTVATVVTTTSSPVAASTTTTSSAAASSTSASSSSSSSGANKRGLVFTDVSLVTEYLALGGEASWAYNWAPSASGLDETLAYYPMLWGTDADHTNGFAEAAEKAIAQTDGAVLSFNEPDIDTQANMSPSVAAAAHKEWLNQYSGQVRISSPAVSSSDDPNQGIGWLTQWKEACNGDCAFDFCAGHWYGPGDELGADLFLAWTLDFVEACDGKPVWITEFQATSGDVGVFLDKAMNQMETNSSFSAVEKYSYFYLSEGFLFDSATTLSTYGALYAGLSS
ncbi:glycoside hydrolase family 128 protein [Xylariaceae sp. FL1272]|nr:glycoside hydrolase family 128 protein [Xylariaceae sp. FL1272]